MIKTIARLILCRIVAVEFLTLETRCNPVGGRNHPLQEGGGFMVGCRRIDQRVGGLDISGLACADTADKW